jgi:hypothetical protein
LSEGTDTVRSMVVTTGVSLFALVCGLHDVGKASPAFQAKVPSLASAVQETGLGWSELNPQSRAWHHTLAGFGSVPLRCPGVSVGTSSLPR